MVVSLVCGYLKKYQVDEKYSNLFVHIITQLQVYVQKYIDIFEEIVQLIMADDFYKEIDEIEITDIDINLYYLRQKLFTHFRNFFGMNQSLYADYSLHKFFSSFLGDEMFEGFVEGALK